MSKLRNIIDHMIHNPNHGITYYSDEPGKVFLSDKDDNDKFTITIWDIMEALNIKEK